jgi:16S rRNA U1498 N3-methylase RsmE
MIKRECEKFQKEFEDTNAVIRIRKSKKNRQQNGQKKKYKRTNHDLQNIHIKLKIEKQEPTNNPG